MILYGRNAVLEALRGRRRVLAVSIANEADREQIPADVDVTLADSRQLEQRSGSDDHQGFVAEAEAYPYADATSLLQADDALVVALDEVTDPHNLGAVARSRGNRVASRASATNELARPTPNTSP